MEGMLNYFIPEDGDSSDHLNVVPLPRVDQLKLQHVKKWVADTSVVGMLRGVQIFPLPGQFHFRFKTPFEGTYVWLDLVNDSDTVPDFNGLVISKIARVQRESTTRPAERVEAKAPAPKATPDLIQTSHEPAPAKREEPAPAPKVFNDDLVGLLSDPVPASPAPSTSAPPTPPPQANPAPQDPFNLFMGGGAASPMRPMSAPMNAPRGPPGSNPGAFGGNPGFNPMGGGAPRPGVGMGISQMHLGMNQVPHQQQQQQQQANSFQGLQWGGMGGNPQQQQQQQQQRNPMQQNPNNRQW